MAAQHAMTAQEKVAVAAVKVSNKTDQLSGFIDLMSCSLLGGQGDSDYHQGDAPGLEMEESGQWTSCRQGYSAARGKEGIVCNV